MPEALDVIDLGRLAYAPARQAQDAHHADVLAARQAGRPVAGRLLLVEHDPVITVSRRPTAAGNLLATPEALAARGVDVQPTDRGGDITYHGPGQLVAYPILDLNHLGLKLIEHVRLLEGAIVDALASLGLAALRDPAATGVWLPDAAGRPERKVAAVGVRVRRWVSMHGLALNVRPDLSHFDLIVPCGLAGRPVTSLHAELGQACPSMDRVKAALVAALHARVNAQMGAVA